MAGNDRNICVSAAGGSEGSNGTRPRRVTVRSRRVRRYAHFDDPLTTEELDAFAMTEEAVAAHAFLPLVGYQKVRRKIDFSVFPPLVKEKERAIRYASHRDSAIYALYAEKLSASYERFLGANNLGGVVLAYRSGIGYNVPFARALFDEIRHRGDCVVLCLDIKGFFDHLRHDSLKEALLEILSEQQLPRDWYKLFRRLTKLEYILRNDIENEIGKSRRSRICSIDTFRRALRRLIRKNTESYGIPQGTPLSGLLANVYMGPFDRRLYAKMSELGGSYRRYSDDIALVAPLGTDIDRLLEIFGELLAGAGLRLSEDKTCRTTFRRAGDRLTYEGDLLQYLGFTFDGQRTLIRPESMKAFYARMKSNIRRYIRAASKRGLPLGELRKRVLVGRFTHWGDNRNFVQYAYRASRELQAPEIKRQLRRHVEVFDRYWTKTVAAYPPAS